MATVNNATMNMGIQILFSLDIYPEVGLLNHMAVLFLIYCGTSILFSILTAVYIPMLSK